ncbi:hypothetical protein NKH71_32085 [Mesorhizobium sp. M0983]|uniref:hypothetical protein n=1 Tax=Mesorhizobium sp. M0983 TaxID=2957040 RepID=UPI003338E735
MNRRSTTEPSYPLVVRIRGCHEVVPSNANVGVEELDKLSLADLLGDHQIAGQGRALAGKDGIETEIGIPQTRPLELPIELHPACMNQLVHCA